MTSMAVVRNAIVALGTATNRMVVSKVGIMNIMVAVVMMTMVMEIVNVLVHDQRGAARSAWPL